MFLSSGVSGPAEKPRQHGRTLLYGLYRACERVSPIDLYGKPADMLTQEQQAELIAFDQLRGME